MNSVDKLNQIFRAVNRLHERCPDLEPHMNEQACRALMSLVRDMISMRTREADELRAREADDAVEVIVEVIDEEDETATSTFTRVTNRRARESIFRSMFSQDPVTPSIFSYSYSDNLSAFYEQRLEELGLMHPNERRVPAPHATMPAYYGSLPTAVATPVPEPRSSITKSDAKKAHPDPTIWDKPDPDNKVRCSFKALKKLPKAQLESDVDCNICFESHKKPDTLSTACGHDFCIGCWKSWMCQPNKERRCPVCRENLPKVSYFTGRKTNK
jgi:hypothetical protein